MPSAREEDDTLGVIGQVRGIESRLPAVDGVGERKEPGDVGISRCASWPAA